MPRGGSRAGAGRRPGRKNAKTLERLRQIEAAGLTPLEVMLQNMRFAHSRAVEALDQITEATRNGGSSAATLDGLKEVMALRKISQEAAKDAAPYVHPRLAATVPPPPKEDAAAKSVRASDPPISFAEMAEIYGGVGRKTD